MKLFHLSLTTGLTMFAIACAGSPPEDRVPEAQARAAALAEYPTATVQKQELEKEDGRWIYSYDLAVPGGEGVEEIHVDAITGKVIAHEHEDEATEADEADESSR